MVVTATAKRDLSRPLWALETSYSCLEEVLGSTVSVIDSNSWIRMQILSFPVAAGAFAQCLWLRTSMRDEAGWNRGLRIAMFR
jgi:hypothetical protein